MVAGWHIKLTGKCRITNPTFYEDMNSYVVEKCQPPGHGVASAMSQTRREKTRKGKTQIKRVRTKGACLAPRNVNK